MEWEVFIIGLALAVAAIVYFLIKRPMPPRQTKQPPTADPTALRRERLEAKRQHRAELESKIEEEESLLFEDEEKDFLQQELKEIRQTRRERYQSKQPKP